MTVLVRTRGIPWEVPPAESDDTTVGKQHAERSLGRPDSQELRNDALLLGYRPCHQSTAPARLGFLPGWFSNIDSWYLEFEGRDGMVRGSRIRVF